jgi:hypothetical protein
MKNSNSNTLQRKNKRTDLCLSIVLAIATPALADDFSDLISNQYAGTIQLQQISGPYVGTNFGLTSTATTWRLELGQYKGVITTQPGGWSFFPIHRDTTHQPVDLYGYWIFRTDVNRCWQVQGGTCGPLVYWNQDGKAQGNPENWELFTFKAYNPAQHQVKIQSSVSDLKTTTCWVNIVGNTLTCNADEAHAAIFTVIFGTRSQVKTPPRPAPTVFRRPPTPIPPRNR